MADTKITDLGVQTGSQVAGNDQLVTVDVSDVSMAASGTTKSITVDELIQGLTNGRFLLVQMDAPPSPPSSGALLYARRTARTLPTFIGPSGIDTPLQPHLGCNRAAFFVPTGNGTVVTTPGIAITAIGTATRADWANTNMLTNSRRISYVSAGTAGSSGGWREAVLKYSLGTSGWGGFDVYARFGFTAVPATARIFHGLHSSTSAIGNVDPSTLINMVGLAKDEADSTLQFMHNDATGSAPKIDTGIALTVNHVYDFRMFTVSGNDTVHFWIKNLVTDAEFYANTGVSTDLPVSNLGLAIHNWANNGSTASAINPMWMGYYIETNN